MISDLVLINTCDIHVCANLKMEQYRQIRWTCLARFCPALVNVEEMFSREKYIKDPAESFLFARHQITKCPTGSQNVWQSIERLPDNLPGTPEIILAITEFIMI